MITDILPYFPIVSNDVAFGLFKTPVKDRTYTTGLSKKYGVNKTLYGEALQIIVNSDLDISLLDMFHGHCLGFAEFFNKKHPDYEPMLLERHATMWNPINHVFCVKHLDDGTCIFADARGLSDNPLEFFADYSFSKRNMDVYPLNFEPYAAYPDKIDYETYQKTYETIFKNCAYF